MGYQTWLDGTLALDPFPDHELACALRAALAGRRGPSAGRLSPTPLGHGLVCEDAFDWEAAVSAVGGAGGGHEG